MGLVLGFGGMCRRMACTLLLPLMSACCSSVASSVRTISRAMSRVSSLDCCKSLDCVFGEFIPNMSASRICSSAFEYWHSEAVNRRLLRKLSTVSFGDCFMLRSLNLAKRKFVLGATYFSNLSQYGASFLESASVKFQVCTSSIPCSPDHICR